MWFSHNESFIMTHHKWLIMTHKWEIRILKKVLKSKDCSTNQTISHLEFMLEKGFDPGLESITSCKLKICQLLSWFQVKQWEQDMRIAKDSFQDFLIYVDAVSSIIFIMKTNAICILTRRLKGNYQIFIQDRLPNSHPIARWQGQFDIDLPCIWSIW